MPAMRIASLLALAVGLSLPAAAATLEEVERDLTAAYEKLTSFTADTTMKQRLDLGGGNLVESDSQGRIEWLRDGAIVLLRTELKSKGVQKLSGSERRTNAETLIVGDGQVYYTMQRMNGETMAYKHKANEAQSGNVGRMLQELRKSHELELLADAKVDGADCYVIEARGRQTAGPLVRTVYYFRKDIGINVKSVGYDQKGGEALLTQSRNVKVGVKIDKSRFEFEAPAGVNVVDMSGAP